MSKRGNMIKMVTLLQNRGRMKTSELARELEVSERQIRTYRNDLEMGGIFINYKCGRYGGYELASPYLNFIDLSVNELATLNKVRDQLHADESQHLLDYNSAYEKLIALYKHRGELRNYTKYFMARDRTDFLGRFYENNNSFRTYKLCINPHYFDKNNLCHSFSNLLHLLSTYYYTRPKNYLFLSVAIL